MWKISTLWTESAGAPLSASVRCLNVTSVFHVFQTLPTTKYELEIVAKDMAGSEVGLTGTATATITIADKNDHAPEFTHPLVRRVSTLTQHGFRSGLRSHWCLFPIMQNTINFSTNYTDICCEKLEKSTIKRQIRGAYCHYIRQYVFGQIFSFGILLVVLVTGVENVEKMLNLK